MTIGIFQFRSEAAKIEIGEFFPLSEDEQRVGSVRGFVRVRRVVGYYRRNVSWARSMAAGS